MYVEVLAYIHQLRLPSRAPRQARQEPGRASALLLPMVFAG